jgi:hypothetical protein
LGSSGSFSASSRTRLVAGRVQLGLFGVVGPGEFVHRQPGVRLLAEQFFVAGLVVGFEQSFWLGRRFFCDRLSGLEEGVLEAVLDKEFGRRIGQIVGCYGFVVALVDEGFVFEAEGERVLGRGHAGGEEKAKGVPLVRFDEGDVISILALPAATRGLARGERVEGGWFFEAGGLPLLV